MREPVRIFTALVAAVVAAIGALTASGVLPTSVAVVLTAVSVGLTAAVGEYTRARVTPTADPRDNTGRQLVPAGHQPDLP